MVDQEFIELEYIFLLCRSLCVVALALASVYGRVVAPRAEKHRLDCIALSTFDTGFSDRCIIRQGIESVALEMRVSSTMLVARKRAPP